MNKNISTHHRFLIHCNCNMRRGTQHDFMIFLLSFSVLICFISCRNKTLPNQGMIDLLKIAKENDNNPDNIFSPEAKVKFCDSIIDNSADRNIINGALNTRAC